MQQIKKWLRKNFGYGKKEMNGSIILLFVITLSFLSLYLFDYLRYATNVYFTKKDLELLDKWKAELKWVDDSPQDNAPRRPSTELKNLRKFDPNKVSEEELLAMNLPRYLAANWAKYTARGGRFSVGEELRKLYGMDSALFEQIIPFVVVQEDPTVANAPKQAAAATPEPTISKPLIDINSATPEELQTVRGIGPAYSNRIVKYRKALGGFHSKDQLKEVYGLKQDVIEAIWQKFKLDPGSCCVRQSVNTVVLDSLRKLPYINFNQAKALIAYRDQHGRFDSWDDVAEIKIIPDSTIQKLKPYFEF